jgi:hypothetical protein
LRILSEYCAIVTLFDHILSSHSFVTVAAFANEHDAPLSRLIFRVVLARGGARPRESGGENDKRMTQAFRSLCWRDDWTEFIRIERTEKGSQAVQDTQGSGAIQVSQGGQGHERIGYA